MRLVTFDSGQGPRSGELDGGEVFALTDQPDGGLGSWLRSGTARGPGVGKSFALDAVRLRPPVPDPRKIVCIGLNYRSHAEEVGLDPPQTPTFFAKWTNALAAAGETVTLPAYSGKVDFEAEVAFVVGDECKDVTEPEALDHIAGYTLLNDLSARDYQFKTPQWLPGKVFDGSAPCGPMLVTLDEAGAHDELELALTLNGEEMQRSSTADLIHSIPALMAYLSKLMTLEPGDIVSTGTPAGVGSVREPRIWLRPDDELVIDSPQLGTLRTPLA